MDQNKISSTPVAKLSRKSLAYIKKNTVSGMVNRFTQKIDSISEATGNVIDSKLDSAITNSYSDPAKALLAEYEKFPNFKFKYLKYFGVNPKEYLSSFNIDYDPVSESIRMDSSGGDANGGVESVVVANSSVRVSNLKYFAAESRNEENVPVKVVAVTEHLNYEDISTTKVTAIREAFLEKSLRSIGVQTSPAQKFQFVDSNGSESESQCKKVSPMEISRTTVF